MKKPRIYHTTESFKEAVASTNPHALDLSKVKFISRRVKVEVTCKECGSDFLANPQDLIYKKTGCPTCKSKNMSEIGKARAILWEEAFNRIKKVHGDTYKYIPSSYKNLSSIMEIVCEKHGIFTQIAGNHASGARCPSCIKESKRGLKLVPEEDVFKRAEEIHKGLYRYIKGSYIDMKKPMEIVCSKHGIFYQLPNDHLDGHGCPKCGNIVSKPQEEIFNFIKDLDIKVIDNFRLEDGKHLDILCPSEKIAIEYNGLKWHSEEFNRSSRYHLDKTNQALSQGYRLIHIFEDEYLQFPGKVFNFIKTALGKNELKYDARKLKLDLECSWVEAKNLLEQVHMQGAGAPPEICIGLRDLVSNDLISVMTFDYRNIKQGEIELTRFCSKGIVRGGFSKLLNNSIPIIKAERIVSFSDTRLSQGNVYLKNGFIKTGTVEPRYWYVKRGKRYHRRGFQKQYLKGFLENYNPLLTEKENCQNNGYFRIWDCGKDRWELKI